MTEWAISEQRTDVDQLEGFAGLHLKYGIETAVDGVDDQNGDQKSLLMVVCVQADHYLNDDEADDHNQRGPQQSGSEMNFVAKHRARQYKHRKWDVPCKVLYNQPRTPLGINLDYKVIPEIEM